MATETVRWVVVENHWPQIIKGLEQRTQDVVRKTALDIEAGAKVRAPVLTGFLRGSIQATEVSRFHWRVVVGADYGLYVEYGTVHSAPHPKPQRSPHRCIPRNRCRLAQPCRRLSSEHAPSRRWPRDSGH